MASKSKRKEGHATNTDASSVRVSTGLLTSFRAARGFAGESYKRITIVSKYTIGFVKECGLMLQDLSPKGLHGAYEWFCGTLREGETDKRVQILIEGLLAVRKAKIQGYLALILEVDLVKIEDQLTHENLSEHLGMTDLKMQDSFKSIFSKGNPKNTGFAINFFTSTRLGGITENLGEYM
ncbi:hypothetical protein CUMW_238960 [Citrus unshiu]|uniref:Uncharacterized protein n=1 Tax=Citrus unshiu TaxID=55188 RepID=A0A2H5QKJ1_CITUN|nr:hypothetical protein CUMW_238960 [Citrus unshiu]